MCHPFEVFRGPLYSGAPEQLEHAPRNNHPCTAHHALSLLPREPMRPTLLLIHGFPLDHTLWDPNIAALSSVANVFAPDLPGFGEARNTTPMRTMDATAAQLLHQLDMRGIDQFIPCGLSMGGYIAMALAERAPARVAALILCNTRSTADTEEGKRGREATAHDALEKGMSVIARAMVPKVLGATTRRERPSEAARIESMIARQAPEAVAAASRAMALRPDRTAVLRDFQGPALVITGDEDELMPLPTSTHMAEALSHGQLVIIPGAGHLSNTERPDDFHQAVLPFLRAIQTGNTATMK